jgi:hypothetical protein
MEDKAEEAVQEIKISDLEKLISTMNNDFSRLDEKRISGESIQNDLVEVFSNIFVSAY